MWINVPILASAPVGADSTLDWNWLWEAFAQSVGWSGKPSPSSTWQRRWKRAAWFKRLCGRIYEPSMAARGVESWIASLRATHASLSASPASVVEKAIQGTFGRTSVESLAKWNRQSCFSKTCPAILASASRKSPAIFKQWVTKLRRDSLLRRKSALVTDGNGSSSSLWRSPTSQQPGVDFNTLTTKDGSEPADVTARLYKDGLHRTVGLPQQTAIFHKTLWATPRAEETGVNTTAGTTMWPEPTSATMADAQCSDGGRTVSEQNARWAGLHRASQSLARTAELWPPRERSRAAQDRPQGRRNRGRQEPGRRRSRSGSEAVADCDCTPNRRREGFTGRTRRENLRRSVQMSLTTTAEVWRSPRTSDYNRDR